MKKRQKDKGPAQLYLERIGELEKQIDRKRDRMERLYCLATKCTPTMSTGGGSVGGNSDKMAPSDASMDLEAEIVRDRETLKAMINEACDLLEQVRDERYYKVLYKHYIEYKAFEEIAVETGYTYRNAHYLHGRALQVFGRLLEEYRIKRLSMTLEERIKERSRTPLY